MRVSRVPVLMPVFPGLFLLHKCVYKCSCTGGEAPRAAGKVVAVLAAATGREQTSLARPSTKASEERVRASLARVL